MINGIRIGFVGFHFRLPRARWTSTQAGCDLFGVQGFCQLSFLLAPPVPVPCCHGLVIPRPIVCVCVYVCRGLARHPSDLTGGGGTGEETLLRGIHGI